MHTTYADFLFKFTSLSKRSSVTVAPSRARFIALNSSLCLIISIDALSSTIREHRLLSFARKIERFSVGSGYLPASLRTKFVSVKKTPGLNFPRISKSISCNKLLKMTYISINTNLRGHYQSHLGHWKSASWFQNSQDISPIVEPTPFRTAHGQDVHRILSSAIVEWAEDSFDEWNAREPGSSIRERSGVVDVNEQSRFPNNNRPFLTPILIVDAPLWFQTLTSLR